MNKTEYNAARALYLQLLNKGKENRTEVEEAQYLYLDKLMTYINLRATARQMGNKNPDDNFLVKGAKEKLEKAQNEMHRVMEKVS